MGLEIPHCNELQITGGTEFIREGRYVVFQVNHGASFQNEFGPTDIFNLTDIFRPYRFDPNPQ